MSRNRPARRGGGRCRRRGMRRAAGRTAARAARGGSHRQRDAHRERGHELDGVAGAAGGGSVTGGTCLGPPSGQNHFFRSLSVWTEVPDGTKNAVCSRLSPRWRQTALLPTTGRWPERFSGRPAESFLFPGVAQAPPVPDGGRRRALLRRLNGAMLAAGHHHARAGARRAHSTGGDGACHQAGRPHGLALHVRKPAAYPDARTSYQRPPLRLRLLPRAWPGPLSPM